MLSIELITMWLRIPNVTRLMIPTVVGSAGSQYERTGEAAAACCLATRLVVAAAAGKIGEERGRRREERKGEGIKGLTLNLLSFSLSVSLIYIRGFTITNGPGPIT